MTVFGMILRGANPGLADAETGLAHFFQTRAGPIATGIIFADVFATITGTSNGRLVAISQTIRRDLLGARDFSPALAKLLTLGLGLVTPLLSLVLPGNVHSLAFGAVSMIGAAVAAAVIFKVLRWRQPPVNAAW